MAVMMIPILAAAMPEVIKLIGELIEYLRNSEKMTPEQRAAKIVELTAKLEAVKAKVAALEVRDV